MVYRVYQALLLSQILEPKLGSVRVAVSRDEDDNRVIETAAIDSATCIIISDTRISLL